MSESDSDDWFNKDLEDFKVTRKRESEEGSKDRGAIRDEATNVSSIVGDSPSCATAETRGDELGELESYWSFANCPPEYSWRRPFKGGPTHSRKPLRNMSEEVGKASKSGSLFGAQAELNPECSSHTYKRPRKKETDRKVSKNQLFSIAKMDSIEVFLEIMYNLDNMQELFLDKKLSHGTIVLMIVILGKMHELPMTKHLESLAVRIFGSDIVLRDNILDYVRFAVDLEEKKKPNSLPFAAQVWGCLESFCSFAKRIEGSRNCWAYFTRAICRILEGKTEGSLQTKYAIFSKIRDEIENNWRFTDSKEATMSDLESEPVLQCPETTNGKFQDVESYLTFNIVFLKSHFLTPLYNGVQECRKLTKEEKQDVVLKNIGGTNVFPCVRIRKSYPSIMSPNDKFFILDLVPHDRVDYKLPQDLKEKINDADIFLEGGTFLFMSTTSSFKDAKPVIPLSALYIVGDIEAYAKENEKWRIIKNRLEAKEAIGSGLPIKCEKHGSEMIMRGPEDFLEFAEEGCSIGKTLGESCL
ncbi:uncharacterized protein LOC132258023 [Phlebotomus argentipes]|uniref:uncharacterized protein LOC132258023 n=1 Tax=Phlebotomus argentipes TaxID=94469 RepID=UPI002892CE8E|nr:uncharacterized protein LOC132258023 [Phlebotomus argentipes]